MGIFGVIPLGSRDYGKSWVFGKAPEGLEIFENPILGDGPESIFENEVLCEKLKILIC